MKHHIALLRLRHAVQLSASVNGNPRWKFSARTADGLALEFKTATDVNSAYGCDLSRLKLGDVIRARYHETATGTLIVDRWDDARTSGDDLPSQFDALELQHQLHACLHHPQTTASKMRL